MFGSSEGNSTDFEKSKDFEELATDLSEMDPVIVGAR